MKVFFKEKFFLLISAIAGMLIVLYGTYNHGPNITHDSVAYIYGAKSLFEGRGLIYFGYGTPIIQWPPLYFVFLALGRVMGINPVDFGVYLNAVIFGLIVFFSGILFQRHAKHTLFVVLGVLAVIVAMPLLGASVSLWSEPLFILLTVLFFLQLEKYIEKSSLGRLVVAALFVAAACMTRYVGITLICSGVILLLIKRDKILDKLKNVFLFGAVSTIPLGLWLIRNFLLSGTFTGGRSPSQVTLAHNLKLTANIIADWFIPERILNFLAKSGVSGFLAVSVILGVICLGIFVIFAGRKNYYLGKDPEYSERSENDKQPKVKWLKLFSPVLFTIIYLVYLIGSASTVAFDPLGDRLLSPVIIPIILMAIVFVDYVGALSYNFISRVIVVLLSIAVFTLCVAYPFTRAKDFLYGIHNTGAGTLASKRWIDSPMLEYLKTEAKDGIIYSDHPDAILIHTGIDAHYAPKKKGIELYTINKMREQITESNQGKDFLIAWFSLSKAPGQLYNVEELKEFYEIDQIAEFSDGIVYRIVGVNK